MLMVSAVFGMTGVILGAFGAHALKKVLAPEAQASFEVGVRYQLLHAVALLALAAVSAQAASPWVARAGVLWTAGIVLFSGSIYLLSCRGLPGMPGLKVLGPVTPLGGLLLILGWGALLVAAWKARA
ncbi:MAG: DUF423 domain-containing protein [Kiritimatiellia bacterium]